MNIPKMHDKCDTSSVVAVIITYNPDFEILKALLSLIKPQVENVIIVDNGSREINELFMLSINLNVDLLPLNDNLGIAKAQNVGITYSRKLDPNYVLLLDQDSLPAPDLVKQLVSAAKSKQTKGIDIGGVGPNYKDPRQINSTPFIQIKNFRVQRHRCDKENDVVEVDYLISSGCLIPISTLDKVGGMREELFIDYVDIEWGLRAKTLGFKSFGVCAAHMNHQLGDEPVYFFGRHVPVHSPLRHYYHFRNAVWLYRQSWLNSEWKIVDGMRLLRKFIFYSSMTSPRLQHCRMMFNGILHGFCNKMGRLDIKGNRNAEDEDRT